MLYYFKYDYYLHEDLTINKRKFKIAAEGDVLLVQAKSIEELMNASGQPMEILETSVKPFNQGIIRLIELARELEPKWWHKILWWKK